MIALALFFGVYTALQFSFLPSIYFAVFIPFFLMLSFFLPLSFKKKRLLIVFPSMFVIGFLWVVVHGYYVVSSELPDDLQGTDLLVIGTVSNLPQTLGDNRKNRTRFMLTVDQLSLLSHKDQIQQQYPKKIRLSWYGSQAKEVKAGEKWQLKVRLKQPHGMLNPGSFDYEKWLFERKIRATGYVKKSAENYRIERASVFEVNAYREALKNNIMALMPDSSYRGIVLALTIGDKSEITDEQWQVFTATGTNHLVAISGLHIGLVAGAFYFIVGFLARRVPRILIYFPYYKIAAFAAIVSAFLYAMLAGFAIPTQRALVMICVVMVFMMINRRIKPSIILSSALIIVLFIDPFSALSVGFWLSFIAVAAILYAMQSRVSANSLWWRWGRLQWIVTVALVPALLLSFQMFSLVSPLANAIAVPWVSFFVVPLSLIGAVFSFIAPFISPLQVIVGWIFSLTDFLLHYLWVIMAYFAALPYAQWQQFSPLPWTLIPGSIGVLLMLSPKGFPSKALSIVLLLPMFIVKPALPPTGQFAFTLLDVGQGLAAVVQTQNHLLVFDTGPKFSSGFDTGEAVVLPYLRSIGIEKINTLVVSHTDNDHMGGASFILKNLIVDRVLTSVPEKFSSYKTDACISGQHWKWDGVYFEILSPSSLTEFGKNKKSGNNRSCVLRVSIGNNAVLLTGDIEKKAEKKLLRTMPLRLPSDILVAPHHGSNTSSTEAFIKKIGPAYVLYPTGFRNRYGFPRSRVVARYQELGIKEANTATTGAISFDISADFITTPVFYREKTRRFWHHWPE